VVYLAQLSVSRP